MKRPNRHTWEESSTHRYMAGKEYDEIWDYAEWLEDDFERLEEKYYELICAVAKKHPGETRHETALRYIRESEQKVTGPSKALGGE